MNNDLVHTEQATQHSCRRAMHFKMRVCIVVGQDTWYVRIYEETELPSSAESITTPTTSLNTMSQDVIAPNPMRLLVASVGRKISKEMLDTTVPAPTTWIQGNFTCCATQINLVLEQVPKTAQSSTPASQFSRHCWKAPPLLA